MALSRIGASPFSFQEPLPQVKFLNFYVVGLELRVRAKKKII
jgi:hypothetical protein